MIALSALVLAGCGKKEQTREIAAIKVSTLAVGEVNGNYGQGYPGTIEEWSATALSFALGGTVKQVMVKDGQMVSRGQLLATIDATTAGNSLAAAQVTTSQASDMVEQTQELYNQALDAYNRMKILHDNGSLPEIKWIEVETRLKQAETALKSAKSGVRSAQAGENIALKSVADTRMTAPSAGYVARRQAEPGQTLLPGAPVLSILQIDRVKVKISVPESEISGFATGQNLAVVVGALDGRRYTATVSEKGVSADPLSRTYEVRATIDNSDRCLLPGMVCQVYAGRSTPQSYAISLPAHVVQLASDNTTFVWTVVDGKAHKTVITTGDNEGDNVMVTSGLKRGDRVIVEGQQKVTEGMQVKQ